MGSIFSKIIAGEIPCYKIYEDEKTLAFLDIHPETPGHTLVIPKVEVDKLYDLEMEDYLAVMKTVKILASRMEKVLGRRTLMKVIGTDVPHAHVHLVSLDPDYQYGQVVEMTEEEMKEMQKKLTEGVE
ncbi:HIT domain-containing protein [TM7 phylum sp. oral taxon 351]|jgi:putative hit-family protein|nr:HIT domain-containing protein [TM7 phylum sp. oral taxon 351]